jgi:anti-sigma factor RsiW
MLICSDAIKHMHEHLDGDLPDEQYLDLKLHMELCGKCRDRFAQLQKLQAVIQYEPEPKMINNEPADICQRIMNSLPKVNFLKRLQLWVRLHTRAVLFSLGGLLVFAVWLLSLDFEERLMLKIPNQDSVVINGDHVEVPQQTIIHGDVFVGNGTIDIAGRIEGDIILMNSQMTTSQSARIEGEIHRIDYAYERWLLQWQQWFE